MDHKLEHQNISTSTQFITRPQFPKKTTQFLLSVSLFSLLLAFFSYLHHSDSLDLYFQSSRYKLFTYTIDKNCMFLLCNGLLVFLAKYSGLVSSSPSSSDDYDHGSTDYMEAASGDYEDHTPMLQPGKPTLSEKGILLGSTIHEEAQGEENDEHVVRMEGEVDKEIMIKDLVTIEDHEEEKGVGREIETGLLIVGKEAEALIEGEYDQAGGVLEEEFAVDDDKFPISEEEEGNGVLTTEELNKKFDEFIRKMKEGIRIEAQQQLVMVN